MGDGLDVTLLPASVSPLVAGAVSGTPRRCRVLGAFPTCLYLDLGAHERVLAVLTTDAVPLPIGLHLAVGADEPTWAVEPGQDVVVGAGRVQLPRADVVAARIRRPDRVRPVAWRASGSGLAALLASDRARDDVLAELAHDLVADTLAGRPADAGVRGLIGAGRGLTPSGDDVLCGVLLTLAAIDDPTARAALSAIRSSVGACLKATTSLSAALLVAAGAGYAVPDVVRLVSLAVATGSSDRPQPSEPAPPRAPSATVLSLDPSAVLDRVLDRVLAIGHSSGRDLVSGLAGAIRALDESLDPTHEGARRG
jgi:hypothetical protein